MKNKALIFIVLLFTQACDNKENYTEYHSNKQLKLEGQFLNDKKVGEWVHYDSLGNKTRFLRYENDTLKYREIYVGGKLLTKEEMHGEKKHGETLMFYEDGRVESKTFYVYDRQTGEQLFYFPDGKLKSKYIEQEHGAVDFYQYYPNGQLLVFAKDLQNGVFNIYDSLGNRTYNLLYQNSEVVDTLKIY